MSVTAKRNIGKRTAKKTLTKKQKLDRLVKEIEEARRELKEGKTVDGTAAEIIRYLRDEIKKSK